ncbi:MAG TPA: quinone-dependent dihydroorotate dehydrogenase [Candidatus Dojkabacteria bacterium]|nr:quinone-dependent dihydroorotate dehydrogenase [Candidatus Dojkabacteria bacterium]
MRSSLYTKVIKPILFKFDPEFVHNLFTSTGRLMGGYSIARKILSRSMRYDSKFLEQEIAGISFKNPVGLAAGFDYNGNLTQILESVGFGFESVGTVTYSYYEGNKKPRLVRLPKSQSILVNKGFKSDGIKNVLNRNMPKWSNSFNVGVSIGATNSKECSTPLAQIDDIVRSFEYISKHEILKKLSYLELNISCPNVLGSGSLATPEYLKMVLRKIRMIGINKPLFVKFQLEIEWEKAKELVKIMVDHNVDAIILSNLLKNREAESIKQEDKKFVKDLKGNFSGKPTYELSNQLIENVYKEFGSKIKIIGLGGIFSAQDAYEKIKRGASLVQLITGMIYEGPQLIGEINRGLEELARKDGFNNIQEAVGSKVK